MNPGVAGFVKCSALCSKRLNRFSDAELGPNPQRWAMRTWTMLAMWRNSPPRRVWAGIVGCLLFLSAPLVWSGGTLEVVSPASDHQWQPGTTASIRWNKGNAGTFLRMELHKAGKRYRINLRYMADIKTGSFYIIFSGLDKNAKFIRHYADNRGVKDTGGEWQELQVDTGMQDDTVFLMVEGLLYDDNAEGVVWMDDFTCAMIKE